MQPGYYWAKRNGEWVIVEAVRGLHGAVLERGCSVQLETFDSKFVGPLPPPPSPDCTPCWVMPPMVQPGFVIDWEAQP